MLVSIARMPLAHEPADTFLEFPRGFRLRNTLREEGRAEAIMHIATVICLGPLEATVCPRVASRALGDGGRLCRSPDDAARESMAESHRNEPDEEVDGLDDPMLRARKEAQLRDAQGRNDEAPDEDQQRERSAAARQEPDGGESQQTKDEEAAEHHVELQQRQGAPRPEEDSEHHESDAEEADEQTCSENDVLHRRPRGRCGVRRVLERSAERHSSLSSMAVLGPTFKIARDRDERRLVAMRTALRCPHRAPSGGATMTATAASSAGHGEADVGEFYA